MRIFIFALAVICAALIGLGSWFNHEQAASNMQAKKQTQASSDYYMKHATIYQLGDNGDLAYRMQIADSLHFPDDSVKLSDIRVHYLHGTKTYWGLHANKGRIPPGQEDLYLYDGVNIEHPRENGNLVKAKTAHAWVKPHENRIDTNAKVSASEPGHTITGDGAHIDLKTNTLKLLSNVHVTYTY